MTENYETCFSSFSFFKKYFRGSTLTRVTFEYISLRGITKKQMSHRLLCRIEQCTFRDKFRAMLRYLILVCLVSANLQGFILAKESCSGGRSLRGLTELKPHYYYGINNITTSVSCCDENVCHGGLALKNEQVSESSSFIINKPFGDYDLQHQYAQQLLLLQSNDDAAQRHKR